MSGVLSNDARRRMFASTIAAPLVLRLFENDAILTPNLYHSDFVEPTFNGYRSAIIVSSKWKTVDDGVVYPEVVFTLDGWRDDPAVVYGYTLSRAKDGELVVSERFEPSQTHSTRLPKRCRATLNRVKP